MDVFVLILLEIVFEDFNYRTLSYGNFNEANGLLIQSASLKQSVKFTSVKLRQSLVVHFNEKSCKRNCRKALILPIAPKDCHEERFVREEVLRCFKQVKEPLFELVQRWVVGVPGGFDLFEPLHVRVEILCRSDIKVVGVDVSFFQALHHGLVEFKDLGFKVSIFLLLILSANHAVDLLHKLIDALLDN